MEYTVLAPAKINLGLEILGKNNDGYHNVEMVMQTVSLYDKVTVSVTSNGGINVICDKNINCESNRNIAYRCAEEFFEYTKIKNPGITIKISKNIPMEAGLAGGSTDAAAVFRGMNEMFGLNLTVEELWEQAVKLGADIPYCITGGTYLSEGIGEKLTKICDSPKCYVLLAKPSIAVSTKWVYENLHANELEHHPDIDGVRKAIEDNNLKNMCDKLENRMLCLN